MLQIIKKDGREGYEEIFESLSLTDNPAASVSEAKDGDRVDGYGIYEITPEEIKIYSFSYGDDLVLGDGIIRSVLFLAALKGIEKAEFLNGSDELPKRLKLIRDGNVLEPISDIFGGCEDCKNK